MGEEREERGGEGGEGRREEERGGERRREEERGGESVPGGRLGLKVCVVRMVKRTHLQWHSGHRLHGRSDWLRSIGVLLGS